MNTEPLWEPWRPEIGQAVRVVLSPECEQHWGLHHDSVLQKANGATGTVRWTDDTLYAGHPIVVDFDQPFYARHVDGTPRYVIWGVFAVIELESCNPAPPAPVEVLP